MLWFALSLIVVPVVAVLFLYLRTPMGTLISHALRGQKPIKGRVIKESLVGSISGNVIHYVVYLPEGYDVDSRRYTTLYHLHELIPGGAEQAKKMIGLEVNRLAHAMEKVIEAGVIEPCILVAPYDGHGNSMWSDSRDGKTLAETNFIRELIPHVDGKYRTLTSRDHRVVQGFSMGGYGAMKNVLKFPDLFSVGVNYDGALHDWVTLTEKRPGIAEEVFDNNEMYFDRHSPWTLAGPVREKNLALMSNVGLLKPFNRKFRRHMEKHGAHHVYAETPCRHDFFSLLDKRGEATFQFIAENLGKYAASAKGNV